MEWCEEDDDRTGKDGQAASFDGCYSAWEYRLTGYTASNKATVKVRKVPDAGAIIDRVTKAADDLALIHGISVDIDDPKPFQDKARVGAAADMKREAQLLAEGAPL